MIKPDDPRKLAIDLLPRSICSVQVAAVIADNHGIFSWGWNSVGSGLGEHAEAAAIRRANKERLAYASIYVVSRRKRTGKWVTSRPCAECYKKVKSWHLYDVYWMDANGKWNRYVIV